jgi:abortive infection bacteriophage resistance protein
MKTKYQKSPKTYQEQLNLIKRRGLIIPYEEKALRYLSTISYYRLSAYMIPFQFDKEKHLFKEGTTFEEILRIYIFDRKLRLLLFDAIERIEIAVRTQIIYELSHKYDSFWVWNKDLFKDRKKHNSFCLSQKNEIKRSDQPFINHYYQKYDEENLPAWMALELVSIGQLSSLFSIINDNQIRKKISIFFGLQEKVFSSWLHTITTVRNICAHHSRLWNREFGVKPIKPKSHIKNWLTIDADNNRVFYIISILIYFMNIINPNSSFKARLKVLLKENSQIDLAAMGFPKNWNEDSLYK